MDRRLFGARLRARREARRWTQAELAGKCGTVSSWISHFEAGRRLPSLENFRRLCSVLGVSADSLLYGRASLGPQGKEGKG